MAVAEGAESGIEGFDGGEAGGGIGVGFGGAGVGGLPAGGNGAGFDGLDGAEHGLGVAPTGIEQQEGAVGVVRGEGRGVGGEQEVAGEVGAAAEGIGEEGDAKAAAQRADGAFARAFAPAHDDQDGRSYGGGGAQGGTGGRQA